MRVVRMGYFVVAVVHAKLGVDAPGLNLYI